MITFKQFISEEEQIDLVKLLLRDCKPYIEALHGDDLLRRGVRDLGEAKIATFEGKEIQYSQKAVRKDRKPKDMKRGLHHLIDDWFDDQFRGLRPRSEGMFCFGEGTQLRTLAQYGEVCYVFPIGEFKYVWSPKVDDLYNEIDHRSEIYNDEKEFNDWMQAQNYRTTGLDDAVQKNVEVMIMCDSYYAFGGAMNRRDGHVIRDAVFEAKKELMK
jgi:hypothetical protein